MYDGGVAADHDDAGDEEGDHQLVPGEVDPDSGPPHITPLLLYPSHSPDLLLGVVAVGDRLHMCTVGVVICEHILQIKNTVSYVIFFSHYIFLVLRHGFNN